MENQQTSFFKLVLKSLANLQEEKEKLAQAENYPLENLIIDFQGFQRHQRASYCHF